MKWPQPLKEGRLLRRYKRFLADILDEHGEPLTIHCPNTGSMRHCQGEGVRVWYWDSQDAKRKLPHTWELVDTPVGGIACINTQRANQVVGEALNDKLIPSLAGYDGIRREVAYGSQKSRIDFLLEDSTGVLPRCFVEVKSVTLKEESGGCFPDAVSARATKHLEELRDCVAAGDRAVLLFCVNHTGIESVSAAAHIDPVYAERLAQVMAQGVEVEVWQSAIDEHEIRLARRLPFKTEL